MESVIIVVIIIITSALRGRGFALNVAPFAEVST